MAEGQPSKGDIELVFKRLRAIPTNKVCFDCTAKNPTWSSVTYGVFICIDCSAVHRSLGVHLTFVRSTQLDTNWTWLQLRQMQLGGNANAESFFQQHNCNTKDAQQKYNSRAAQLYKEKLLTAATQAMRLHGTKILLKQNVRSLNHEETSLLYLDADNDLSQREDNKEIDFFEQHDNFDTDMEAPEKSLNCHMAKLSADNADEKSGPSVNFSSSDNSERKPTIGNRKPQAKRPSGLGGKKGGLGAQRVKTNFADIEREAEMADKLKIQEKKPEVELTAEEEEAQITSMRLAYEDLSLKQKKEEEKMKAVDPLKAQQLERLGMGLGARSGISHSALSDMKTIEQENPSKPSKAVIDRDADDFFDDFGFVSNSSFTMYKSVPRNITSILGDGLDDLRSNKPTSFWDEPPDRKHSEKTAHVEKKPISPINSTSNEAQMKFGTAKAISSDQFFSDSNDNSWERKTNLSRFEGSSSISSAEFFGRKEPTYNRGGLTPDLEDVKESVRQGVTKVAGKLSSLANGVMSSIQDKYGF